MGQPIPEDPPPRAYPVASTSWPHSPPAPPPLVDSVAPPTSPQVTSSSRLPPHLRFNSPTYGLDPEVAALMRRAANNDSSRSTTEAAGSAEARPRLSSPPRAPFDGTADESTAAWTRWLDDRRHSRRVMRPSPTSPTRPSTSVGEATASLSRLRESAERLRSVEAQLGDVQRSTIAAATRLPPLPPVLGISARTPPVRDSLSSFTDALEEPRRALEQVRQRLDETRRRVAAVAANSRRRDFELDEVAERARAQARESLDRTVDFASRLDQLAQTLNTIAQRAAALTPALEPLSAPTPLDDVVTSPSALEPAGLAAQTDSIRATVRQLILASRRVSAAVERHRETAAAAAAAAASAPAMNEPLRVVLPTSFSPPDPLSSQPDTSPNPSGLLLPTSNVFTASLTPLSPRLGPFPAGAAAGENYPGERAQLLRIAALQADIAARAGELRDLRARGEEVDRERRALERGGRAGESHGGAEEKEDDEGGAVLVRSERVPLLFAGRAEREIAQRGAEEGGGRKRLRTADELRRDYEMYSFCGR